MANLTNNKLFNKLQKKGFRPEHAAEVGVYYPETSNIYNYIINNTRCTLVEPDPESISRIKNHFGDNYNIHLHTVALSDLAGTIELVQRGASTFSSELSSSPSIINDNYNIDADDKFIVESVTFDSIDDSTIDLLSVDIEGSEWFVIKHMRSRPVVISVETHGAMYINPYIENIKKWMKDNNYTPWYKDDSDTVYVKKNSINLTAFDALKLHLKELHLVFRYYRKKLKLYLKHIFKQKAS